MHSMRSLLTSVVVIVFVVFTAFWRITGIYFQQDEWLGLGGAIYRQETLGTVGSIAQIFNFNNKNESTRFLPITSIANHLSYTNFGLHTAAYGLISVTIGLLCALLINSITYKLTNSYLLSTFTSILWITNNLAYQAFTWIATMMPSLLAVLFFLLGLHFLLIFKDKKKNYTFAASLTCVTLSLFSKESGIFYFITFSLVIWLFFKKGFTQIKKIQLTAWLLLPLLLSLALPRLLFLSYNQNNFSPSVAPAGRIEIAYNLFLIPARSLFHVYFPQTKIYELAYLANTIHYSAQTNGFVVESIIADSLSLLTSFYFLLTIFAVVLLVNSEQRKIILFSLISFFASTMPFVIFKNDTAILETRFYVFPALWASLLLCSVVIALFSRFNRLKNILFLLVFIPLSYYYISGVRKALAQDISIGNYRKDILNTVSAVKPQLTNNNIFYFFTDSNGFYEFQSGFGQTLAVFLYDSGNIPKEILVDRDYWDPSFEGLKSFGQAKYGYFMTYEKLLQALREHPEISLNQTFSFYWNPQKHTVTNISVDIRDKLRKDITNEKN